eukprot:m.127776 g.127776  ORF g.127776 m.127776 type:complete len:548 (-) comp14552_c0_seq10:3238-4881(-)
MPYIYFDVCVTGAGSLGIQLRSLSQDERDILPAGALLLLLGYHRPQGSPEGMLEKDYMLHAGDILMSITGNTENANFGLDDKDFTYQGSFVMEEVSKIILSETRPLYLRFAREATSLADIIQSCLLPPPTLNTCIPVLRAAIRRAAIQKDASLDALNGLRALAWRVLLGSFSINPLSWEEEASNQRKLYQEHAREIIKSDFIGGEELSAEAEQRVTPEICELWASVQRDVVRTYFTPGFVSDDDIGLRRAQMHRVLFVYAVLNRGVGYVQGMNEICAGLMEVLIQCCNLEHDDSYRRGKLRMKGAWKENLEFVEEDVFWLFSAVVAGPCRDAFIADNDSSHRAEQVAAGITPVNLSSPEGLGGGLVCRLSELERRIKLVSPGVYKLLHNKWKIRPHIYAARWYSVLFRREYQKDDNGGFGWRPNLWDYLFAFTGGDDSTRPRPYGESQADCLLDYCCAFVTLLHSELAKCADANAGLSMLISRRKVVQMTCGDRIPPPNSHELLLEAQRLRQLRNKVEYHNQIKADVVQAVGNLKDFFFGNGAAPVK